MTDRIERVCDLDAAPRAVWRALTDPAWLASWLADEAELELEPGGEARFVVDGRERSGWVEEVVAPAGGGAGRLSFWWQEEGEPASRVSFVLEPTERGTRLRIVETRPLEVLDLVGVPLRDAGGAGRQSFGPALVAA
ncbi:MAG TPA: SRPBCC family protein [Solirubrobacteraceae bacterium]|nr:SRPBCC family protein [Solirubrobacteraceae bacterium]